MNGLDNPTKSSELPKHIENNTEQFYLYKHLTRPSGNLIF